MMLVAWNGYRKYAWGKNELKPMAKKGFTPHIFGHADDLGLTIIDAMDTLLIMGLNSEVKEAVQWVKHNFSIIHVDELFNLFTQKSFTKFKTKFKKKEHNNVNF
jgi:mannosyl-oligosaccharide alpha-1,2-mannosidase